MVFRNVSINKILLSIIKSELDDFENYYNEIERKFIIDKKELIKSYDNSIENLSDEEKFEVASYYVDDIFNLEEIFPYIFRKSILVYLYSYMEATMKRLCIKLYSIHKYDVSLKEFETDESGIFKLKEYMVEKVGINFSLLNNEWNYIVYFSKIRNCIVHYEGNVILNDSKKLIKYIEKCKELSIDKKDDIIINREYIDNSIKIIYKFFEKIYLNVILK